MNIFKRLFAGRTPTQTEKILDTMAAFTEAAYLMSPASDESDAALLAVSDQQTRQQTVFVFLFGALDVLVHDLPFDVNEKIDILQAYLQRTFQAMTQANREAVATFLIHASGDPDWTPIMQRGGQAMVDQGRGESLAPLMLGHIVSFGLEDADMMARDRSRNNANNAQLNRAVPNVRRLTHVTMTADEYFNDHIPHRLNLLVTFRTRYSDPQSPHSLNPEAYRDLFRCAKDICFLMVRFLCGELGVFYCEKSQQFEDAQKWTSRFGSTRLPLPQLRSDRRYSDLCQMYQAANQAVAHIDSQRADHSFRVATDDQRIIAVIHWIEESVRKHIYADAGRDLTISMSLPSNQMT